jgi:hypothetical protein
VPGGLLSDRLLDSAFTAQHLLGSPNAAMSSSA